jgi:hypothetical protein
MKVKLEEPTLGLKIAMQLFQSVKHLLKDSLIIQEENTKKNHKRVVYISVEYFPHEDELNDFAVLVRIMQIASLVYEYSG